MNILVIFLQMLPLIVFIIVDSIINNIIISIISAIIFSIVQMIITYIIIKKIDYFILIDAGLMVLFGVISILFNNEIFFKIKPALIEGIFVIFIFIMLFLPKSILINYFSRYMGGMKIKPEFAVKLKKILLIINIYTLLHICAVFYTAFYSSKKVWALISGPGFYFIIIPIILFIIIKKIILIYKWKKNKIYIENNIINEIESNDSLTK